MKYFLIYGLAIPVFFILSCQSKERYGGRMTIDSDTGVKTPLNQEACYYLAYESLTKKNSDEAQSYLKKMETFPQPSEKKIILEEGAKTLWALSYLQKKNYDEAINYMRLLNEVKAISFHQAEYKNEFNYKQLRRIRSSSIQLRKSLPALEEYFAIKQKNALNQALYLNLKKGWRVELQYQIHAGILNLSFSFPPLE